VLPPEVASTETSILETVVESGTGRAAAIGQFAAGKTGTTTNYGDAWFVGWDSKYTVAVWVGYPNSLVPMTNDFNGGPVLGGTFPALIWHDFMTAAMQLDKARAEHASTKGVTASASGLGGTQGGGEGSGSPSHNGGASRSSAGAGKAPAGAPAPSSHSALPPAAEPARGNAGAEHAAAPEAAGRSPAPEAPAHSPAPSAQPPPPQSAGPPTGGVSPGG
jgi:penicillin-binding protein 1A